MSYMSRSVDTGVWVIEGRQGDKGACAKDGGDTVLQAYVCVLEHHYEYI